MTLEKTKLSFEGQSIFSTLEGVYQHFLRPRKIETTLEWGSRVSFCLNTLTPDCYYISHQHWSELRTTEDHTDSSNGA